MRDDRFGTALVVRGTDSAARTAAVTSISSLLRTRGAKFEVE
jgi:hypothetical protein